MNKSILVVALLAVALTACGKKEEPKAAAPALADRPQPQQRSATDAGTARSPA